MKQTVYNSRYLKVEEETCKIKGRKIKMIKEVKADAVFVLPELDNGKLLVEKNYRPLIRKHTYEFPAGYVDKNEKPADAAARELEEETGYVAGEVRHLISVYSSVGWGTQKYHFYYAKKLKKGRRNLGPAESIKVLRLYPKQINKMIINGNIVDEQTVFAFLYYATYAKNKWTL